MSVRGRPTAECEQQNRSGQLLGTSIFFNLVELTNRKSSSDLSACLSFQIPTAGRPCAYRKTLTKRQILLKL